MKSIIPILIVIFLIGVVSAVYPGETTIWNNQLSTTDLTYSIQNVHGNTTAIPKVIVTVTKTKIYLTIPANMPPCSFDIVFVAHETEIKPQKYNYWWWFFNWRNHFMKKHIQVGHW